MELTRKYKRGKITHQKREQKGRKEVISEYNFLNWTDLVV